MSDESRRAFERALPGQWVFRSEHSDYGIDGQVEIFDDTFIATGNRFYVQLKATDGTVERARSVRLTRDAAQYYHSLELPVLLVSYHAPTETLYVRWFQEINPPDEGGDGAKTLVVAFDDANKWTTSTPNLLVRDVSNRRLIRGGSITPPLLLSLRLETLNGQADLVDALSAALVPLRGVIELIDDGDRALGIVSIQGDRIVVWLGREISRSMSIPENVSDNRGLAADTLLLLALALGRAQQAALAAKVALAVIDESRMIECLDVFIPLAKSLEEGHRMIDALELSDRLVTKYGSTWAAEALRSLAIGRKGLSASEVAMYERYLDRRIALAQTGGDPHQIAIAYYNRGNHRRGTARRREALRDYVFAGRSYPDYWQRDYFCTECGGLFFVLGHFRCAATLYQKGVERGAGPDTKPLLADALMFAGEYEQAEKQFTLYLGEEATISSPEWVLKNWALGHIVGLGVPSQKRQTRAALAHAGSPATIEEALRLDALCGLAWFNQGAAELDANHRDSALRSYLLAAVCQTWDLEAWRNAYALATEREEDRAFAPWILWAAYELNGERFFEELAGAMQGPVERVREHVRALRIALDELPRKHGSREFRLLGPESEYIAFDLTSGTFRHGRGSGRKVREV